MHPHKHPVAQLIHNRLQGLPDTAKLAVVAEDGGQRWVVPGGMVARLETHGIVADIVGGASGGALAGLYYGLGVSAAGVMVLQHLGREGYDLHGGYQFIDLKRVFGKNPVMDIEGLIDDAFTHRKPVPWYKLKNHPRPLFAMATTACGQPVLQRLDGMDVASAKLAAKNTARIPWVAHPVHDENVLWDGALSNGLPVDVAFELGATHVLVLRCKGADEPLQPAGSVIDRVIHTVLNHHSPSLQKLWQNRHHAKARQLHAAQANPNVLVVQLPQVPIDAHENRAERLLQTGLTAWHHLGSVLGLPPVEYPPEWQVAIASYNLPSVAVPQA